MRGILCSFHMAAPRESAGEVCRQSSPGRALGARGQCWLWLGSWHSTVLSSPCTATRQPHAPLGHSDKGSLSKHSHHSVGQHQGRLPWHTWELLASLCALCKHFLCFSQLQ